MLKISREGSECRVELFQVNRLNTLFSELVKEQLQELVEEPGISVIFNLEGIRFIDTSGFDVLIGSKSLCPKVPKRIRVLWINSSMASF